MIFFYFFLSLLCSTTLLANSHHRVSEDNLTYQLAQKRKSQIKDVNYNLEFELFKGKNEFHGRTEIKVILNKLDQPLSIDIVASKIESLKVNNQQISIFKSRVGSLDIPSKYLSKEMKIEIQYVGQYSKESGGFLKSIDPEDGSEYVYTDFEPYYAHKLFPCFDQPDLKARYDLKVIAPKDWKVIGNELILSTVAGQNEKTITTFKTTPKLSTYLFFLGAGPFTEWVDQYQDLPLTLYARKSLAQFVDHEEIFRTTKKGLTFFNNYFDYKYPFSKYGQIFIPEFAWGGMENPGAVTLNERNIFRGPVPQSVFESRNNLILHEMAHMWFGDLVTMKWWNDLWLNESFASYLASIAQERAMGSYAASLSFFSMKTWGYWQDQLMTTHPIETNVPDVRTAKANFDGITYAKGASALKQLHFFVGEEGFRDGLRNYFKKYAFKNTIRQDFINSIAEASKTDLKNWTKTWLQTAGPNRVSINFTCKENKIEKMWVQQKKNFSKTLSPHRFLVGLFVRDGEKLNLDSTHDVTYSKEKTSVLSLIGKKCPDFVLPNFGDQDYALFSLDKESLKNTVLALTTTPDPLSRLMIWSTLSQMVRDAELKPRDYFHFVLSGLQKEQHDLLLGNLIGRHSAIRNNFFLYLKENEREKIAPSLEKIIYDRVGNEKPGSSLQMAFFDFYVSIAQSKEAQERLYLMLTKNSPPNGIVLDQDRRWSIILNLASNGNPRARAIKEKELEKDKSTQGERMALAARAAIPDIQNKVSIWNELTTKELPYSYFKEAASRFHSPNHVKMSQQFVDLFFKKVTSIDWKSNDSVVDIYFEYLFPLQVCSKELLKLSQGKLKSAKNLTSIAKRSWLEANDELSRCVNIMEKVHP